MLKRAKIKNFKSLRDVSLTLGVNNVLVGPNMSGKSNLLDFFRFFKDLIVPSQSGLYGLQSAFNPRNGFTNVVWRGAEDPRISFELEGSFRFLEELSTWNYKLDILGNFQWGNTQVEREELFVAHENKKYVLIETKGNVRNMYNRDGKQVSELSEPNRLALEYEFPQWEATHLRNTILTWKFYSLLPPLMRAINPTAVSNSLSPYGENLSAWLMLLQTRYAESFDQIKTAVKDVFPQIDSLFTTPTQQSTVYLTSREKFLKKPITVTEMSEGELVFLALLSLLYAPLELGSDVTFVEEPENHLHPRLMATLIDLLRQVQSELEADNKGQIFITTHSPHLIDKFSIDELIVMARKEGATSVIRPGDAEDLRKLVADGEIGLGDLYFSGALSIA